MLPLFIKAIKPPAKNASTEPKKGGQGKKTAPDISHFTDLLGVLAEHKAGGNFGPDSVDVGHHVAFKAGDYVGSGKVTAKGRDGLCVTDSSKREHRVHWREVTGHFAPEEDADTTPRRNAKKTGDGK